MVEVGLAEYFGIGEALGKIGKMLVVLYFSKKHLQRLTVDIETKVPNDLEERMQTLTKMTVDRPELIKILNKMNKNGHPKWHMFIIFCILLHKYTICGGEKY
jgi:hypothetical protein